MANAEWIKEDTMGKKEEFPHKPRNSGPPIKWEGELWEGDKNCRHVVFDAFWQGGGVKCGKCGAWYCA